MRDHYQDAALVILGHGSTLNAESAAPTYQHADNLRKRNLFAQVLTGFWKQEPGVAGVLRGVFAPRVFIVPLFISEGYFTEEVLPRELGFAPAATGGYERVRRRDGQMLHYCGPVGTHDRMTQVLLARAKEATERHPPAPPPSETALFIAGHGTGNNENSRKTIERQADLIRAMNRYAEVHAVFMEEAPRVGDCYTLAQARNLVMVPFFISDGLHSYEDIPMLLGEEPEAVRQRYQNGEPTFKNPTVRKGKKIWYAASIGTEPLLAEVVLERVREQAAKET